MSRAVASTYRDISFEDIFDFGSTQSSIVKKKQEKIEIEFDKSDSVRFESSNVPIFIQSSFGSTATAGISINSISSPDFISFMLSEDMPIQAKAFIADKAQSSKALVEGCLSQLLSAKALERNEIFNSLVQMEEPELILSSAFDLFEKGRGERVLSYATSILERSPLKALEAFRTAFSSQPRGVELLLSSFLNTNVSSNDKVAVLMPLADSSNTFSLKVLIEELQNAPSSVAKPLLERILKLNDGDVSELAKEFLQEIA